LWKLCPLTVEFPDGLVVWRWLVDCIDEDLTGFLLLIRSMLTNQLWRNTSSLVKVKISTLLPKE